MLCSRILPGGENTLNLQALGQAAHYRLGAVTRLPVWDGHLWLPTLLTYPRSGTTGYAQHWK